MIFFLRFFFIMTMVAIVMTSCVSEEPIDDSIYEVGIAEVESILRNSWGNFDEVFTIAIENDYVISIEEFHKLLPHISSQVLADFTLEIMTEEGTDYILKKGIYIPTINNEDISVQEFEIVESKEFEGMKELKVVESGNIREPYIVGFRRESYYSLDTNGEWKLQHYSGMSFTDDIENLE